MKDQAPYLYDHLSAEQRGTLETSGLSILNAVNSALWQFYGKASGGAEYENDLDEAMEILSDFTGESPWLTNVSPRMPNDRDKIPFGQRDHKGFVLQLPSNGVKLGDTLGTINVYGGLRQARASGDDHDQSVFRLLHTAFTDHIVSQSTRINFHITNATAATIFEVWLRLVPKRALRLDYIALMETRLDFTPSLGPSDPVFTSFASTLDRASQPIISLVPSW